MNRRQLLLGALSISATMLFASCKHEPASAGAYVDAGPNASAVKAAFNADIGKTRVLMLAAPT